MIVRLLKTHFFTLILDCEKPTARNWVIDQTWAFTGTEPSWRVTWRRAPTRWWRRLPFPSWGTCPRTWRGRTYSHTTTRRTCATSNRSTTPSCWSRGNHSGKTITELSIVWSYQRKIPLDLKIIFIVKMWRRRPKPGQGNLDWHGYPSWFSAVQDEVTFQTYVSQKWFETSISFFYIMKIWYSKLHLALGFMLLSQFVGSSLKKKCSKIWVLLLIW